jgi:hypothetical protein
MHYRVAFASPDARAIAVRDAYGRCHVARSTLDLPAVGSELHGAQPILGFCILAGPSTRQFFRVTFELVGCDSQAAQRRLSC